MRLAELSDDELIAEYRRASAGARGEIAGELFGRYYEQVARWCYRFTGTREAAADLAQDVFLKAHLHLDAFRGAARFSTWLYSIVRNESINRRHELEPAVHDGDDMPLAAITRLLRLENASGAKAYIVSAKRKLARAARRLRAKGKAL